MNGVHFLSGNAKTCVRLGERRTDAERGLAEAKAKTIEEERSRIQAIVLNPLASGPQSRLAWFLAFKTTFPLDLAIQLLAAAAEDSAAESLASGKGAKRMADASVVEAQEKALAKSVVELYRQSRQPGGGVRTGLGLGQQAGPQLSGDALELQSMLEFIRAARGDS